MGDGDRFVLGWERFLKYVYAKPLRFKHIGDIAKVMRWLGDWVIWYSGDPYSDTYFSMKPKDVDEMAKSKKGKTPYERKTYVKVELNEKDKSAIRTLAKDGVGVLSMLDELYVGGYTLSMKEGHKDGIVKVYIDGDRTTVNEGLILESAGSSAKLTFVAALYKVVVKRSKGPWMLEGVEEDYFE